MRDGRTGGEDRRREGGEMDRSPVADDDRKEDMTTPQGDTDCQEHPTQDNISEAEDDTREEHSIDVAQESVQ